MALETAPTNATNAFTRNHTVNATIANGDTTSDEIIIGGRAVVNIHLPTVTAAYFTYLVKVNPGDTAVQLVDTTGAAISFPRGSSGTTTGAKSYTEAALGGFYSFQLVSSGAQGAGRTIGVSMRGQDPVPFKPASTGGVVPGDFAAPALTLGNTNVAGSSGKVLATDSTVAVFSASAPTVALSTAGATGSAATALRSDATIVAFDATVPPAETNPATGAAGAAAVAARRDHLHAVAPPATPTTQAFGDAATSGAGTGFATDTHKHGMPVVTFS